MSSSQQQKNKNKKNKQLKQLLFCFKVLKILFVQHYFLNLQEKQGNGIILFYSIKQCFKNPIFIELLLFVLISNLLINI